MLRVEHLSKSYGDHAVLKGIALDCAAGETLSIVGRSGCGKTTLLRILAGLLRQDEGSIFLNGASVDGVAVEKRGVVYLSQSPLLFPHLDVTGNLAFGMRIRHIPEGKLNERTTEMLHALGLEGYGSRRPESLSGGQQQRVAFGRALLTEPRVLLLDEPFGSLDAVTRAEMQRFYRTLSASHGFAALFVTHDVKEALLTGNRFGRMDGGRLVTYDTVKAFADDPATGLNDEREFWKNLDL
jgi:ABC-type Fe3+/spermidine/putrescine transport system ATPase subunit